MNTDGFFSYQCIRFIFSMLELRILYDRAGTVAFFANAIDLSNLLAVKSLYDFAKKANSFYKFLVNVTVNVLFNIPWWGRGALNTHH